MDSQKWNTGIDTGFNRQKAFVHTRARYRSKILWKLDGVCTSFLACTPPKPASSTVFDPPQVSDEDDTDPHIRPKVSIRNALPEETSGIGTTHAEQTIAWPKHGYASRSHGTFLHALARALKIHYMSSDHPKAHKLTNHILHPSPAPCLRSPGTPENVLRRSRWYGMVPVSPTGTQGSLPRILWMGMHCLDIALNPRLVNCQRFPGRIHFSWLVTSSCGWSRPIYIPMKSCAVSKVSSKFRIFWFRVASTKKGPDLKGQRVERRESSFTFFMVAAGWTC